MKKLAILAAVAILVCLPGLASADSVSYITTTPVANTTFTDWVRTLAFQKFDSSMGTLNQVELYLSSSMDTVLTVTNTSTESGSFGNARTELMLAVQDAIGLITNIPQIDKIFPFPPYSYSLGIGGSVTSGVLTSSATSDFFYTNPSLLAEFTGTGDILLNALTFTQTLLANSGGNTSANQTTHAGLTGTVTYTYTPAVPAPATLLLLGSGLIGLLALGRRRKVSKN